jgi:hypothetical protein
MTNTKIFHPTYMCFIHCQIVEWKVVCKDCKPLKNKFHTISIFKLLDVKFVMYIVLYFFMLFLIPQHICSCFSSSYVWLSSQVYNNLLTISDFPPSSSVLMNLFTLMEHKQFHLSCASSLVYSTSL